jgi:SAM-dependent methyltransferase
MQVVLYERLRSALDLIAYRPPLFARRTVTCPVCGAQGRPFRQYRLRSLDECADCTHVYTAQIPRPAMLKLIYSSFGYWQVDRDHQGLRDVHDEQQWAVYVGDRIRILERSGLLDAPAPLRIFEIGCAEGVLLDALCKRGHQAEGCETNQSVAAFGRRELGVTIFAQTFESVETEAGAYDLVASYHTFEHLSDPAGALAKVARMLKPTGGVCLELPIGEEEFTNRDHLHFFTHDSLKRFLAARFADVQLFDNSYKNAAGIVTGSLYGIGRYPLPDRDRA